MPWGWGCEYVITPGGWINIILDLIVLIMLVFALYQVNKTLNDFKAEVGQLKSALEETKRNTEEIRKKLEEV